MNVRNTSGRSFVLAVDFLTIVTIACLGSANAALVSHWGFDSDASDSTGAHNGTLVNGASISAGGQGFGGGEALLLAGGAGLAGAQHVTTSDPMGFDFDTDFTWHAYIKTSATGVGIFGRAPAATIHNQGSKSLFLGGANVQWDTGWVGAPNTGVAVNDDSWHQVIVTFSATTDQLDIFVDPTVGATVGQYTGIHDVNRFDESLTHNGGEAETAFFIGLVSDNFRNAGFNGLIDEAAVFDEALKGPKLDQLIVNGPGSFLDGDDPNLLAPLLVDLATTSVPAGSVPRSVNVSNDSGSTLDLTISEVIFTGGDEALFSAPILPGTLSPGADGDITFTFTPTATGSFTTTMRITSNDPGPPTDVTLNIDVVNDPFLVAPSTVVNATSSSAPVTESITISNSGVSQTLNITSVTPVGADAARFAVDSFPATIGPGLSANIEVTFTPPGTRRTYSTDLVIVSDSTGGSPTTIALDITVFSASSTSLIAYWSFETSTGSITPDVLGAHNGTLVNGASISTGGQGFGGGEALSLAGGAGLAAAQHVTTANPTDFDFDSDFTWHAYIKTSATGVGIFGRAPAATIHNQGSKSLFLGGANAQWDTGWVGAPSTNVAVNDGNWHQVIVTFAAATDQLDIFVDPSVGATVGQYTGIHDVNRFDESTTHNGGEAETAFFIGLVSDNFRNAGFNGLIDEAAVFDEALTGPDLDQLITDGPRSFFSAGSTTFELIITPAADSGFDLTWASMDGMLYRVSSTDDLSVAFENWDLVQTDIPATGTSTTLNVNPPEPMLLYRVEEFPIPPVILLDVDFESDDGGFAAVNHGTGTIWALGAPNSTGEGGSVSQGNGGSVNCWGTDLTNPGFYATGTDTSLISPVIDLTGAAGATLSFAQAIDILAPGDTLVVNIIDDTTDTVIEAAIHTSTPDGDINAADWETVNSIAMGAAALGQAVRIEWRFTGTNDGSYMGAYIDDVVVTVP